MASTAMSQELPWLVRVVDESGEDYLYPEKLFVPIALSRPITRAMQNAA